MKVLLAGGGTGGHVYPLIAIAEELNAIADEEKILNLKLYYMADAPMDKDVLEENFITYIPITAGKIRVYASFKNITDLFKTGLGILGALWKVFNLYPDIVISKGGYASFPVLFAARLFRIPVIIHESDTVPGRVSRWSGKFAKRIALSFPEAAEYFPKDNISYTGQPIRKEVRSPGKEGGSSFFGLTEELPTIGIIGGSQGAQAINEAVLEILPQLVARCQIIHQVGTKNVAEVKTRADIILKDNQYKSRHKIYASLNNLQMKMFAAAVTLVVSRSGSSLFEFAAWGKPSILIPYPLAHGDHQKKNAYHYARSGACAVIEEVNLTPSVLLHEIEELLTNREMYDIMAKKAKEFFKPDAARVIAAEAVSIALRHER
ncbi:MAG TPA: undecaprenyldiphospho-muramoylpentapeptide beta-N-acetylglucosaminyltransferase [Candidatus Paceibacterota bacterium]|nr:undecaprenyldiphospho-muramoylpentapeptide beta-N-acetylglucosaminyltransferase [Candidatus Paceibacterota bacterium]